MNYFRKIHVLICLINAQMKGLQIKGQFKGCVQVKGRNAFGALLLLTL